MPTNYNHLDYQRYPFFRIGIPNQWHEEGYFLCEGKVYYYSEDRKACHYMVNNPQDRHSFKAFARNKGIDIPPDFLSLLK